VEKIMDIQTLTTFFMWCTIINGGLLIIMAVLSILLPDFLYHTQTKWFPMPREKFFPVFYMVIGIFKIFFLVFNAVPYVSLLIMG
jgi:hypothetical protein